MHLIPRACGWLWVIWQCSASTVHHNTASFRRLTRGRYRILLCYDFASDRIGELLGRKENLTVGCKVSPLFQQKSPRVGSSPDTEQHCLRTIVTMRFGPAGTVCDMPQNIEFCRGHDVARCQSRKIWDFIRGLTGPLQTDKPLG